MKYKKKGKLMAEGEKKMGKTKLCKPLKVSTYRKGK